METVSNYVSIVHCSRSRTPSNSLVRRLFCVCVCVGGGDGLPTPSPQFSLSGREVKTDRTTVADFPIGTGRTSSNSYLILFDGFYASSIILRVYLLLVPLFARVVLYPVGDSFRCARLGSCEAIAVYECLLCRVSVALRW